MTKKLTGKIQCGLCGNYYKVITQTHLDAIHPGVTMEAYRRAYQVTTPQQLQKRVGAVQEGEHIAQVVMEHIRTDPALMEDISRRVGNCLFSGEMRGKFIGAVLMVLQQRLSTYDDMMGNLKAINKELFTENRIARGGPDGEPTDTPTLIQMGKLAMSSTESAEEALIRMMKIAVDDAKTPLEVRPINIFTGKHETVVIGADFDPQQRETLRRVGSRLLRKPKTVRGLIEKVKGEKEKAEAEDDTLEADFTAVGK